MAVHIRLKRNHHHCLCIAAQKELPLLFPYRQKEKHVCFLQSSAAKPNNVPMHCLCICALKVAVGFGQLISDSPSSATLA